MSGFIKALIQTLDQRLQTTDWNGKNGSRFQKDEGLAFRR
jgi:hypothetical protein